VKGAVLSRPGFRGFFLSPEELKAVMERVGLNQVGYRRLMLGTVAVHVGSRSITTNFGD
jgi:hypothetical protein